MVYPASPQENCITLGFSLLLLALAIVGSITLQGLGRIEQRVDDVSAHELAFFLHVSELRVHMGNLRRYEKDYYLNIASKEARSGYLEKWKQTYAKAQDMVRQLQLTLDNGDNSLAGTLREPVRKQGELLQSYAEGFNAVSVSVEAGSISTPAEANAAISRYKTSVHQMEGMLQTISSASATAVNALGARSMLPAARCATPSCCFCWQHCYWGCCCRGASPARFVNRLAACATTA
jgi:methyl-accepting chemotaxis protein